MLEQDIERVLFSEEELNKRVSEIAAEINRDYAGRSPCSSRCFVAPLCSWPT